MVTEMIVPAPAPIDFRNGKSSNDNWKRFKLQWKNYEIATGLDKKGKNVRMATFFCIIGS